MSHINKFCNTWNIWILNIYFQILKVRWSFKCFTIQFGSSRGFWTSPVWPENCKRSHPSLQVFQTLISLRSELIAEPEIKIWYLLLSLQEKCSYHTLFLRPSEAIDLLEYSWTSPLSLSIRSAISDPIPSNIKVCGRLEKSKTTWFLYSEPGIIWYEPETISSDGCSSVTEQRENVGSHIPAPFSNLQNSQWKKSRLYFLKNAGVQGDRKTALFFFKWQCKQWTDQELHLHQEVSYLGRSPTKTNFPLSSQRPRADTEWSCQMTLLQVLAECRWCTEASYASPPVPSR